MRRRQGPIYDFSARPRFWYYQKCAGKCARNRIPWRVWSWYLHERLDQQNLFGRGGSVLHDLNVAKRYAEYAKKDMPGYILVVYEGVNDKGADISTMSFYPYEKEKLYSSLVMMECINIQVEGRILIDVAFITS